MAETLEWFISAKEITVGRELGKGSFGVVYAGTYQAQAIALKKIGFESVDEERRRQQKADFERELQTTMKIPRHANVVAFLGVTVLDGLLALCVEFCSGGCLADRLWGQNFREANALEMHKNVAVALGAAKGIYHLHENSIVHRDIAGILIS